jgi:hypothetical protein
MARSALCAQPQIDEGQPELGTPAGERQVEVQQHRRCDANRESLDRGSEWLACASGDTAANLLTVIEVVNRSG